MQGHYHSGEIFVVGLSLFRANLISTRVNVVVTVIALVDCTILAFAISFGCSKQRNVPFARLRGLVINL